MTLTAFRGARAHRPMAPARLSTGRRIGVDPRSGVDHYLKVGDPEMLPGRTQDKPRAAEVTVEVLGLLREDLIACCEPLSALSSMAAAAGRLVTPLRVLKLLIWSEVAPKGYYRV